MVIPACSDGNLTGPPAQGEMTFKQATLADFCHDEEPLRSVSEAVIRVMHGGEVALENSSSSEQAISCDCSGISTMLKMSKHKKSA